MKVAALLNNTLSSLDREPIAAIPYAAPRNLWIMISFNRHRPTGGQTYGLFAALIVAAIYGAFEHLDLSNHHTHSAMHHSLANYTQVRQDVIAELERQLSSDFESGAPDIAKLRSLLPEKVPVALNDSTDDVVAAQSQFDPQAVRDALPACALEENEAGSILLVFMGHSGSSAILSEIAQHSRFFVTVPEPVDHDEVQFNPELGLKYADEFFSNATSYGKIGGFKMRPWHILQRPDEWRALTKKHRTRILWQFRRNIFKQSVGEWAVQYLNDTLAIEGLRDDVTEEERCSLGAGCSFAIDNIDSLHKLLIKFVQNDEQIRNAVYLLTQNAEEEACALPVPYEDYMYKKEATMQKVFAFFGVDFEDHPPFRRKATADNMCKVITNYQSDICPAFYGCTHFRAYLEDQRNNCTCQRLLGKSFRDSNPYCETKDTTQ